MFTHILNRIREPNWKFGMVREFLYPLEELDTWHSKDKPRTPSCLELLTAGQTLQHARLLQESPML